VFGQEIADENRELNNRMINEKELEEKLTNLKDRSDIINATLFNEDGFVIANSDSKNDDLGCDFFQDLAAISSGIISMANSLVAMTDPSSIAIKVNLQGGNEVEQDSFAMMFTSFSEDIHMVVVYPTNANVGLMNFEVNQIKSELRPFL
jgi:predicted regulator of Ras-like GTPase activity (Roadblock/LC7/MglB family)